MQAPKKLWYCSQCSSDGIWDSKHVLSILWISIEDTGIVQDVVCCRPPLGSPWPECLWERVRCGCPACLCFVSWGRPSTAEPTPSQCPVCLTPRNSASSWNSLCCQVAVRHCKCCAAELNSCNVSHARSNAASVRQACRFQWHDSIECDCLAGM